MSKGRILIVEDNMDNYELMRFMLEHNSYEVFLAVNGRDGVNAAMRQMPDLILMDLSMPEMDGWDATRHIKADPATKHIRIFAVTAHALPGDRKRALEAGCDDYIVKPLDLRELVRMVDEAMKKK